MMGEVEDSHGIESFVSILHFANWPHARQHQSVRSRKNFIDRPTDVMMPIRFIEFCMYGVVWWREVLSEPHFFKLSVFVQLWPPLM